MFIAIMVFAIFVAIYAGQPKPKLDYWDYLMPAFGAVVVGIALVRYLRERRELNS